MQKLMVFILVVFIGMQAHAFGGSHESMFKEEWAQGIDSMGVYFGGGKQAQIKFICSGLNEKANSKGVCECVSGYERINGVCVPNPCANFKATDCIRTCTSINGVASYTYGTVCSNGYFCNANHQCENPCYDVECQTCTPKNGQARWTDKANQTSCSTGWCQGGDCVSACTDKTWHQECQECNVHTGAITNKTGNCTNGICQGGSCVPTPVTPTNKCTGVTCDPCNSCDATDGQCKPDNTLSCTNGSCQNGTCVPTPDDKCANVTCDPCNSCDSTDGHCKPDNSLTCTNGTCQGGTCQTNGNTSACSGSNLRQCSKEECGRLSQNNDAYDWTQESGCVYVGNSAQLCYSNPQCTDGMFKALRNTDDRTDDDLLSLDNHLYSCRPCGSVATYVSTREACMSCGNRSFDPFFGDFGECYLTNLSCDNGEFKSGHVCIPCNDEGSWLADRTECQGCGNREIVWSSFEEEYVCQLKSCPSGTFRWLNECWHCDEKMAISDDPDTEFPGALADLCSQCSNREMGQYQYLQDCRLQTCPENTFRDVFGNCWPCDSEVIKRQISHSEDCTCLNRSAQMQEVPLTRVPAFYCVPNNCLSE